MSWSNRLDSPFQKSYHIVSKEITEADASTRFQNDVGASAFCISRVKFFAEIALIFRDNLLYTNISFLLE